MPYSTIMARLELGEANDEVLAITADLAQRCSARVIGIAGRQPVLMAPRAGLLTVDLIALDRQQADQLCAQAEARFRQAMRGRTDELEWRCGVILEPLALYVAGEARAADLIVARPGTLGLGDLVMEAGRPVLLVPDGDRALDLDRVLVAWKDTREARRAVTDALPLLALAGEVRVTSIADAEDLEAARPAVEDVVTWLRRRGVAAIADLVERTAVDAADLEARAEAIHAGLMVAGAYGHARLLEWVLGGVTCDLLLHPKRCTLVSH